MLTTENGFILTLVVAAGAGFIRGFTGFGGPAFMLAILTWFFSPLVVIGKILVIEFISTTYLAVKIRKDIHWQSTLAIVIPTLLLMPVGHWILTETSPDLMRQTIAGITLLSCLMMLIGFRYKTPLNIVGCMLLGLVTGLIFGATYIALVFVATILMGPYSKAQTRSLLISWGFLTAVWFAALSIFNGHTDILDILNALPPAACYFAGTWLGSRLFDQSGETQYRTVALVTLIILSIIGFLR